MSVKLNHYWTIIPEKDEAYGKFMIKEFIPGINRLGMHVVAGWCILVGAYSEIIFETVSNDLDLLEKALRDPKYRDLKASLLNFVRKYKTKILISTERTPDSYSMDIKEETVKFNQMWDVLSGCKEDYNRFTLEEYYPLLEEIGVRVAREWEVFIGEGPHLLCEGRVQNVDNLLQNLQSHKFRKAKQKLKCYVENYESRMLSFHIQKIKGYKSASYNLISDF